MQNQDFSGYSFKCPSCGASVQSSREKLSMFCPFCGAPIPEARKVNEQMNSQQIKTQEINLESKRLDVQQHQTDADVRKANFKHRVEMVRYIICGVAILFGIIVIFSILFISKF